MEFEQGDHGAIRPLHHPTGAELGHGPSIMEGEENHHFTMRSGETATGVSADWTVEDSFL